MIVFLDGLKSVQAVTIVNTTDNYINLARADKSVMSVDEHGTVSWKPAGTNGTNEQFVVHDDSIVVTPNWPDLTYMYGFITKS